MISSRLRRFWSGCLGFLLLAFLAGTSLFVSAEADHDCSGAECPVCAEIQVCLGNLNVVGEPIGSDTASPAPEAYATDFTAPRAYWPPATTLRSLDVRWNE